MTENKAYLQVANALADIHGKPFGGEDAGRYRISVKALRTLFGRKRLYEDDILQLTRTMLEKGYVLIDMDGYFVVLSANSFVNYRRVGDAVLLDALKADDPAA